jgi:hypothetical protein
MTGSTQPSIEDVVLSTVPRIPKVKFYNPFLIPQNGDQFTQRFLELARRRVMTTP